jgi:hypothetical protein
MGSEALTVVDAQVLATMDNPPEAVLLEAKKAAVALRDVIAQKARPVIMNGEQYLEFEDWQTVGRFYGITAREDGDPEFVDLAGVRGFKASAVAVDRVGRAIGRATAYCLNDEEKWRGRAKYEWVYVLKSGGTSVEDPGKDELIWEDNPKKPGGKRPKKQRLSVGEESVPLFQLASMAQTRAGSKVLRSVLSWVVVLAGYRPTPAEEMDGVFDRDEPPPARPAQSSTEPPPEHDEPWEPGEDHGDVPPQSARAARPAQARRASAPAGPKMPCPHCGKAAGPSKYPKEGKTHYCYDCRHSFDPGAEA